MRKKEDQMFDKDDLPEWLLELHLKFREDDEDEDNEEDEEGEEEESEEDEEEESEEDNADKSKANKDGKSKKGTKDDDNAELKKALRDERAKRRKAERDARQARQEAGSKEKKEEAEESAEKLRISEERTQRLATRLRKSEIEKAVLAAATEANFIDPTDALTEAVLRKIEVDQDEDDPSDIDVDLDSVEEAVKAYANKKKHLVGEGTSKVKSGSKIKRKKDKGDGPNQQKLTSTYPSLA